MARVPGAPRSMSTSYSSAVGGIRMPGTIWATPATRYVRQHGTMAEQFAYGKGVRLSEALAAANPYQDHWMWTSKMYSPGTAYYYPYYARHPRSSENINLRQTGSATYAEWLARGN